MEASAWSSTTQPSYPRNNVIEPKAMAAEQAGLPRFSSMVNTDFENAQPSAIAMDNIEASESGWTSYLHLSYDLSIISSVSQDTFFFDGKTLEEAKQTLVTASRKSKLLHDNIRHGSIRNQGFDLAAMEALRTVDTSESETASSMSHLPLWQEEARHPIEAASQMSSCMEGSSCAKTTGGGRQISNTD